MIDRAKAREKGQECLTMASESDNEKTSQAVAVIATHWFALAQNLPTESPTPGSYL